MGDRGDERVGCRIIAEHMILTACFKGWGFGDRDGEESTRLRYASGLYRQTFRTCCNFKSYNSSKYHSTGLGHVGYDVMSDRSLDHWSP